LFFLFFLNMNNQRHRRNSTRGAFKKTYALFCKATATERIYQSRVFDAVSEPVCGRLGVGSIRRCKVRARCAAGSDPRMLLETVTAAIRYSNSSSSVKESDSIRCIEASRHYAENLHKPRPGSTFAMQSTPVLEEKRGLNSGMANVRFAAESVVNFVDSSQANACSRRRRIDACSALQEQQS
jgi:hypothetical protein